MATFTSAEIEFMAEETTIKMVPKFTHGVLHFISGDFGPFEPQLPVDVPLWLAIQLRRQQHCTIVPPDWMDYKRLCQTLEAEEKNQDEFSPLPFHYMELSSFLLDKAAEDVEASCGGVENVRTVLEDIQNVRMQKIRKGMQFLAHQAHNDETTFSVKMNHVGALEILSIRPFLTTALNKFYQLSPEKLESDKQAGARAAAAEAAAMRGSTGIGAAGARGAAAGAGAGADADHGHSDGGLNPGQDARPDPDAIYGAADAPLPAPAATASRRLMRFRT